MIPTAAGRSKLGCDRAFGFGLASLGLPQGIMKDSRFRRVSDNCASAQKGSRKVRSLGRPAALHHERAVFD
jgi:hypothetical protein